ncbi:MAG: endonuclease domain-containing protein [Phycisphaerales bacterium]
MSTRPLRTQVEPTPQAKGRAKALRRAMTMPERVLWNRLKQWRERGVVWRRQHPLGAYIADFYCHAGALVVEVDGEQFHSGERAAHDRRRNRWMEARQIKVVRIGAWCLPQQLDEVSNAVCRLAIERGAPFRPPPLVRPPPQARRKGPA